MATDPEQLIQRMQDEGRFVSQNASPGSARRAYIEQMYQTHLGRPADPEGLSYWMGRTDLSLDELQRNIRGAAGLDPGPVSNVNGYDAMGPLNTGPEWGTEYDSDARHYDPGRADYIRMAYEENLGRGADQQGLDYWMGRQDLQGWDLIKAIREGGNLSNDIYEQDAGLSSFMRNYYNQISNIRSNEQRQSQLAEDQRRLTQAQYDVQEQQGLRNVDRKAESRGMYRSGGRIRDRAELTATIAGQRGQTDLTHSTTQDTIQRDAVQSISDLSRQRDEQEIDARQRLTQNSVQEYMNG